MAGYAKKVLAFLPFCSSSIFILENCLISLFHSGFTFTLPVPTFSSDLQILIIVLLTILLGTSFNLCFLFKVWQLFTGGGSQNNSSSNSHDGNSKSNNKNNK